MNAIGTALCEPMNLGTGPMAADDISTRLGMSVENERADAGRDGGSHFQHRHVQQKSTYARKTIENNELLLLVGFLLPQDKRLLVIFPRNV